MYGSEFIQQLKLSMEDSNSPQTKGKYILLFLCAVFCFFKLVHVSLKVLCGVELWAPVVESLPELVMEIFQDCLERSLIFIKPAVPVCKCVAM